MRNVVKLGWVVVFGVLGFACPAPAPGPQTGELLVSLEGLPAGTDGAVTVTGPEGYSQSLTTSTRITALPVGNYTVTAVAAREPGTAVDRLHDATPTAVSVDVEADATATVTIAHTVRPGTGLLWAPGPNQGKIYGFGPATLQDGGTPTPVVTLDVQMDGGTLRGPGILAVDRGGTLWAGIDDTGSNMEGLAAFPPASLAASGNVTPALFIEPADAGEGYMSISYPEGIAFDPAGNLWLANCGDNGSLTRFAPEDLTSGGPKEGRVWKTGTTVAAPQITCPNGIAFDSNGTMWVSDCGSIGAIYGYTADQLASATAPVPHYAIPTPSDIGCPENIAFDSEGSLWIAVCGSFQGVARYSAAQLAASSGGSSQGPLARISSAGILECSTGLGFDNRGTLWVTNANGTGNMAGLTTTQLTTDGGVVPENNVPLPGVTYSGVAVNPPPVNVPLYR